MPGDECPGQHRTRGGGLSFPFRLLSDLPYGSFDQYRVDTRCGSEPDDVVGVIERVVDGLGIPVGIFPGKFIVAKQPGDPVLLLGP